ncbi:MAG: hypothetical protein KGZ33_00815 [Alkaliphilus sp.]|nr:hypothetical protein [Alkaliphilus sp.]
MRRRRCWNIWRRVSKSIIGLILLITGFVIVAVILFPLSIWLVLLGCAMILLGYKLFI